MIVHIYQINFKNDLHYLFYFYLPHHQQNLYLGVESSSELNSNKSENSNSEFSWYNLELSKRESGEDINESNYYFSSSQSTKNISEGKWQIYELSSLTSTVDSYGFYPETSANINPASNPIPSVYSMLTEDQKFLKLLDVIEQINKEGKYLWRFKKELNSVRQFVNSYAIYNIEKMKNNPMHCVVILCSNSIAPAYFF